MLESRIHNFVSLPWKLDKTDFDGLNTHMTQRPRVDEVKITAAWKGRTAPKKSAWIKIPHPFKNWFLLIVDV